MPSEKQIEAFARYRRKQIAELRPYIEGEDVSHVSISPEDVKAGSPKRGDMIARNPKNHDDQWLVARAYFLDNFEALTAAELAEPAPTARSGAVKVKELMCDFEDFINQPPQYEDQRMVRDYRHELYRKWEPLCRLILAALEPAEPATDAEPVAWLYDWVDDDGETQTEASTNRISSVNFKPTSNVRPLFTRPPESRLREALDFYVDPENWKKNGPLDPNSGNFTGGPARAALAQEG